MEPREASQVVGAVVEVWRGPEGKRWLRCPMGATGRAVWWEWGWGRGAEGRMPERSAGPSPGSGLLAEALGATVRLKSGGIGGWPLLL